MTCDPQRQPDVSAEAVVDPMEGEQTWPTEEEMKEAEGEFVLNIDLKIN